MTLSCKNSPQTLNFLPTGGASPAAILFLNVFIDSAVLFKALRIAEIFKNKSFGASNIKKSIKFAKFAQLNRFFSIYNKKMTALSIK